MQDEISGDVRLTPTQQLPWIYCGLIDRCLKLDHLVPVCGTMYAVCQTAAPMRSDPHD